MGLGLPIAREKKDRIGERVPQMSELFGWTKLALGIANALLLVVVAYLLVRQRRRPRRVQDRLLGQFPPGGPAFRVRFVAAEDLGRSPRALAGLAAGVAYLEGDAVVLRGEGRDRATRELHFGPRETRVSWVPSSGSLLATPSWVRLERGGERFLLTVVRATDGHSRIATRELYDALRLVLPEDLPTVPAGATPGWINWAAGLGTLAILAGVWSAIEVGSQTAHLKGPSFMAPGTNEGVLVLSDGTLHLLDPAGRVRGRLTLKALGLPDAITALAPLGEDFLVGEAATGSIQRCSWTARRCTPWVSGGNASRRELKHAFKIAATAGGERVYVTDTARHRLLVYDAGGHRLGASRGEPPMCFPNGLWVDPRGGLYVADTNSHRIAGLSTDPAHLAATLSAFPTARLVGRWCRCEETGSSGIVPLDDMLSFSGATPKALAGARPGRVWPTVAQRDSARRWWVVNADADLRHGDLLRFDSDGAPPRRVMLPPRADPFDLVLRRDDLLVSDPTLMRIYRVDYAGTLVGELGDGAFRSELRALAKRLRALKLLRLALLAGLLALALGGLWLAKLELQRRWQALR